MRGGYKFHNMLVFIGLTKSIYMNFKLQIKMRKLVLYFVLIVLSSCNFNQKKGGVSFTFDDQNIEEWVNYADLFDEYEIKATFFITRPHLLDAKQIEGLKYLSSKGHEIACHGMNHISANGFVDSTDKYLNVEILPALGILDSLGFDIQSFAYPFGHAPKEMNDALLAQFSYLRGATWNMADTTLYFYNEIFANAENFQVINSMGIDFNYKISLESIKKGLIRAAKNNEVLIFHAHKIDTTKMDYTVDPEYLEEVFKLCRSEKAQSVRIMDLAYYFEK